MKEIVVPNNAKGASQCILGYPVIFDENLFPVCVRWMFLCFTAFVWLEEQPDDRHILCDDSLHYLIHPMGLN
jgi:hypothetical protein